MERPATCSASSPWYTAPVIVGGSGGSGTRGVALMLEALGIGMACVTKDFLIAPAAQPEDRRQHCDNLKCNTAADCGLISSFRTGKAVGGHGAISWLRLGHANSSVAHAGACGDIDATALQDAMRRSTDVCGGSKEEALKRLRHSVDPKYRQPLRWGLKNPHATYYVNALRRVFPCMAYVNTLRDLDVMVRTSKHFDSRVQEAVRYGVITEQAARHARSSPAASQRFLGTYLRRVNGGLHRWLERCMPGRFAHVSLQRLVVRGHEHADGAHCFGAVVMPLLRALEMEATPSTVNATRNFLVRSLPTVSKSLAEAAERPLRLAAGDEAAAWPEHLEARACRGPLRNGHGNGHGNGATHKPQRKRVTR